jgi:hypothetical protein
MDGGIGGSVDPPVRLAAETQLRNGGNSGTGNAFQGSVGFDYMGFSFDALGSKINDAVSAASLSAAQVAAAKIVGCNTVIDENVGAE